MAALIAEGMTNRAIAERLGIEERSVEGPLDRIRDHLVGLKMPRALEALEHILSRLERGELSALEAIDALLGEELTLREGRRVKAALKMGRLLLDSIERFRAGAAVGNRLA